MHAKFRVCLPIWLRSKSFSHLQYTHKPENIKFGILHTTKIASCWCLDVPFYVDRIKSNFRVRICNIPNWYFPVYGYTVESNRKANPELCMHANMCPRKIRRCYKIGEINTCTYPYIAQNKLLVGARMMCLLCLWSRWHGVTMKPSRWMNNQPPEITVECNLMMN